MRRPVNFIVVVWGEKFCDFFLQYCLASLLAPGNIPRLCNSRDRFLIATPADDRERMLKRPQIIKAQRHLTVEFMEIDRPAPGTPAVLHSNKHLVPVLDNIWRQKGYGVMMSPDHIFSNELGQVVGDAIDDGIGLVLLPTIRLAQEPLFDALAPFGINRPSQERCSIDLPSFTLAKAALASLHPEILAAEWNKPYFGDNINSVFWRADNDDVLMHTFSFCPLLIDYALVKQHDTREALISNTDGPYLARNFPPDTPIRVIDNAETVFTVSWAPYALHHDGVLQPKLAFKLPWVGERLRGAFLRNRYRYYVLECRDWLKLILFARPIHWTLREGAGNWSAIEAESKKVLKRHLPGFDALRLSAEQRSSLLRSGVHPAFDLIAILYQRLRRYWRTVRSYGAVVWDAVRGDREAIKRVTNRAKVLTQRQ